jgi:CheY-like chemotaxis protein/signal transduction histidine kinase
MKPPTILIVEDNPTTRKLVRITLECEGYQVVEAEDGRTALQLMASAAPSLVVQDLMLPDLDGVKLTHQLREVAGRRDVPIIVLSGFGSLLMQRSGPGADASLLKPVDPSRLAEMVRSFLPLAPKAENLGRGRLILIADDDPVQLKLARLRLSSAGFEVVATADGAEALALARQRVPDLILSDVLMPHVDGFELCLAVRGDPQLAAVPVVLLSAHYNERHDDELARKVGADALIVRTPDFQAVLDVIATALEKRRQPPVSEPASGVLDEHRARITQQLERQASANQELLQHSALQAAQLSILGAVADALTRTADVEATLGEVLTACLDAGGISKGALFRIGSDGGAELTHAVGFSESEGVVFARAVDSEFQSSLMAGRSVARSQTGGGVFGLSGVHAGLLVPLMAPGDGGCTGVLFLGSNAQNVPEQDLVSFGRAVAGYIGQASSLAGAFARVNITAEASRLLSASLQLEETLASVAQLLVERLGDLCEIAVADGAGRLRTVFAVRHDAAREAIVRAIHAHCPDATAMDPRGTTLTHPSAASVDSAGDFAAVARDTKHAQLLTALGARHRLLVPLVASGRVCGSFAMGRFRATRRFSADDLALCNDLAGRIAVAVENSRLYREVEEASRAKDEFLATVSHELRTPLNAILGWAVMLRSRPNEPALAERGLAVVEHNARAQAKLIEDILDVSRIVTGKMSLKMRLMEIGAVVRAAVDVVFPTANAKKIEIAVREDPSAGMLVGDPERFQQVMWNLLSNAVKFSPHGSRIDISIARLPSLVEIQVADNGNGIHADFLPHVFERFRQGDTSITRFDGGLGLGLALVRHLIDLHGGNVTIESDGVGLGTTVTIQLPAPDLQGELPLPNVPAAGEAAPFDLAGVRVLVVDDDLDARELVAELLASYGIVVRTAGSAAEAMSVLEAFAPTVIVSDLGMPGEDGFSLIKRVRQVSSVPVVALTAYAGVEDRVKTRQAGFQVHLGKPVDPSQLIKAVAQLSDHGKSASG